MRLVQAPWLVRKYILSDVIWDVEDDEGVYITFDDGPHPTITHEVLNLLKRYDAKATFFCVADNVRKYPETFQRILDEGHAVGNHTYSHVKGWETNDNDYFDNVAKAAKLIPGNLFRPPHGRIKRSQMEVLKENYRIVMWSLLSWDFDRQLNAATCWNLVRRHLSPGKIVVFHDSEKAYERMLPTLESTLEYCVEQNWKCKSL